MKKNWSIYLVLVLCVVLIVSALTFLGCKKKTLNPYEVTNNLKQFDSYSCNVNVEIKNDRQTVEYKGKQYFKKQLGYRFDLGDDRVLIYKDDKIFVQDKKNGSNYNTDKEFDEIFKLTFIQEYVNMLYTNEDIKYSYKNEAGIDCMLISLEIPGNLRNIDNAVLYVDMKRNIPMKLIINDDKNKERVKVTYSDFNVAGKMDNALFDEKQIK